MVITIRKPLVSDLHLGEVESTNLSAGSTAGHGSHVQAVPEEGAVDLPCSKARAHTPNVLKENFKIFEKKVNNKPRTFNKLSEKENNSQVRNQLAYLDRR